MKSVLPWLTVLAIPIAFAVGHTVTLGTFVPRTIVETARAATPPPERIELDRVSMVRSLENKLEMTTFSMRLDKYIPGGICNGNLWQRLAFANCVVMLVPGKVNAGFDWATFGTKNITATHETVTVNLGAPKILDVVLDPDNITVLQHSVGAFTSYDKTLQMRVLAQAKHGLWKDACSNGVLEAAGLSGEKQVGGILRKLLMQAGDTRTVEIVRTTAHC